jgi:hypothetical protein
MIAEIKCTGGKEISSEVITARGDSSVLPDLVPEALGEIMLAVQYGIAVAFLLSVSLDAIVLRVLLH